MRIVMIDKCFSDIWYSWYLCKELSGQLRSSDGLLFYSSKKKYWKKPPSKTKLRPVWSPYAYPFEIFRALVNDKPHLVHVQFEFNLFGPIYSTLLFHLLLCFLKVLRVKIIVTVHEVISRHWSKNIFSKYVIPSHFGRFVLFFKLYLMIMYQVIGLFSDRIIVHAPLFKERLSQEYLVDQRKIMVIPHGVDYDYSTKHEKVDNRNMTNNKKTILYFGVLSPRKGLERLIEAFGLIAKREPEYCLVIAGEDSSFYKGYKSSLTSLVNKLGLEKRVIFTGFLPGEDVHTLLSSAQVVVLPHAISISASGFFSLAIQHRKPMIVTSTAFFKESLRDGKEGLMVRSNVEDLAQVMETLLHDEKLRGELSKNLDLKAKKLSWKKVAEKTYKLYLKTVNTTL